MTRVYPKFGHVSEIGENDFTPEERAKMRNDFMATYPKDDPDPSQIWTILHGRSAVHPAQDNRCRLIGGLFRGRV
jgi:hypothetical protein